jgi:Asp-tRNA(Asn)/Glu-tRNA(Gln) amidotransferase A subunit family amidase
MTEPCDLTATEALAGIEAGELSPLELFDSCVARIESINPVLNAVVAMDVDIGRNTALEATDRITRGESAGLLGGLPVGIKDLEATRGIRTTWGSLLYADHIPEEDDKLVADIRRHGGNVFCKTNTPEFGAGGNTVNKVYGATRNPFATELTVAGSSGGTATALATGMLPLATGSDYGGSLRTPAAFNGIVGFRPSPGVVPNVGSVMALSPFTVLGPMGRCVSDVHLQLRATAGFDARDPFSAAARPLCEVLEEAALDKLTVAWSSDFGCCPVDQEIRKIFTTRVGMFGSHFASFDERNPNTENIHDVFEVLRGVVFVAAHKERVRNRRELLGANVIDNTERGLVHSAADIAFAFAEQAKLYRCMLEIFSEVDVLIAPAASVSPFPHSQLTVTEINGEPMSSYMRWLALSYVPTVTLCCSCVLPCGIDHKGLPFGIQIIGANGSDNKVLAVAKALEQVLNGSPQTSRPLPSLSALSAQ